MRGWLTTPDRARLISRSALAMSALLVLASLVMSAHNEAVYRSMKAEEADMQARILAATLPAAMAFQDVEAVEGYVRALGRNPMIRAAAAYDAQGILVAVYGDAASVPLRAPDAVGPAAARDEVVAVARVEEAGMRLGTAYIRVVIQPFSLRLTRHAATVILVLMAAILVGVMVSTQAALSRAHADLQDQITQREKAEAALRQAHKMEAIGQLTGGVAHDFNNLLQALSSCLQMIWRRHPDPGIEAFVSAGRQAVDRGAKLTQQLLAFARRQSLRPESLDVSKQLSGMSELLVRALRADIRLHIDVPPNIWPVKVDATQFELAILNLIVNARDALGANGSVWIEGRNRAVPGGGDLVEVTVRDNGSGMDPSVAARAFDPFFTTKEVGKGSGLGLSQVYGFASQSGGSALIASTPGEGTAVTLLLPRAAGSVVQEAEVARPVQVSTGGRLLLVEDDLHVMETLSATLTDLGYEITRAPDAETAIRVAGDWSRIDLLLTDIVMPGRLSGLDLAREARRKKPGMPVVVMTGYSGGLDTSDVQVLYKPYDTETLVRSLEAARGCPPPV